MSRDIGVVMDPISTINYKKDTSLALLWAARDRGWRLWYMEQSDLYLDAGQARARMRPLEVRETADDFYTLGTPEDKDLADLDAILMRKDPPFDMEFVYTTHLLENAERRGTLIVNRCASLRDCNEKLYATEFPQCCPTLIVSRDPLQLRAFHQQHGDVVFKPLDGMGGSSIFRVREGDPNLSVILETLTQNGQQTIMGQVYLPDIINGDKRILMVNGEPIPYALARVPLAGETRGNLAAGGSGRVQALTDRDRWIAEQVGPDLRSRGLLFVGLDVIGEHLTEINVTSPTCLREIEAEASPNIAAKLMACIESEWLRIGR
ncbi:MAG: glutathione synthase [Luminiphilus sp.]|jgi:glutathione synthase|nr:glutathione synthase [Halieaceae bacterium]MDG1493580.1 glutathione synthase [Luminiphilus sp.]MDG1829366.1 glutathione synthase [Luminiphilus sp.]MDG2494224.1 glutathione synthase [Luminiphilus sp.]